MLEIAPLILGSLAGVATAAAVRKVPRNKNQLLSLGASSHIKNQIASLQIEKDILTKTISRLYQTESSFSGIQKDKLLSKYQHQLGVVLAKLEKLDEASKHPDLGPVGDGLISLMDQRLSKLDDRLYEISSKMTSGGKKISKPFDFEKPIQTTIKDSTNTKDAKKPKIQPFELTTLTNGATLKPKFPTFDKPTKMPEPRVETPSVVPKVETQSTIPKMPEPRVETPSVVPKVETQSTIPKMPEPKVETSSVVPNVTKDNAKPDFKEKIKEITKHKALPEPSIPADTPSEIPLEDEFDDVEDLDKIKDNIIKVLSKLEQAEVE